jgi:hypothetical protein
VHAREAGAVADGGDGRVAGAQLVVHDNAVVDIQTGLGREFGRRNHADADHDEVRRKHRAVGQLDRLDGAVRAVQRGDTLA